MIITYELERTRWVTYQLNFTKSTTADDFYELKVSYIQTTFFDYFTRFLIWQTIKSILVCASQKLLAIIRIPKLLTSLSEVFEILIASWGWKITIVHQRLNCILAKQSKVKSWVTWQYESWMKQPLTHQKRVNVQFTPWILNVSLEIFPPLSFVHDTRSAKVEKFPHNPILHYACTSYNYAFYSLSLNTIDNSLGNWIYTSLIITYCTNKRGFFSRRFFPHCFFPLSLHLPLFLFPISLAGNSYYLSFLQGPSQSIFLFFFLRHLQGSNSQSSIVFVRLAVYPLYRSTCAFCRSRVTFKIIFLIPYSNSKN